LRVALFVPCYVDQLAPRVAEATCDLLERLGCRVDFDPRQTCCGQPFASLGAAREARRLALRHLRIFAGADAIVCPSASCVATVRHAYAGLGVATEGEGARVRSRTFELGEFLVRELGVRDCGASFPHRVALLPSCHGLRQLGLGTPSERAGGEAAEPGPAEILLDCVRGLERVWPARRDECCGFGGGFSVAFPELSTRIGRDRSSSFEDAGAEFVTGTDASCLLHLDGVRRRAGRGPRPVHLAEILAGAVR
jgi:L-lactate dehydrogenase complex protein LldE